MHIIDKMIAPFAPSWALKRVRARQVMAAYEAAKPTRTRKNKGDNSSGTLVADAAANLRAQARHLDQNHDLATGVLNTLVARVVGPKGINVEAMPKDASGKIHRDLSWQINRAYERWSKHPETTGELSRAMSEQLIARTWFRDGEALVKDVMGTVPSFKHLDKVPYSIELLEPDYLPIDLNDPAKGIRQGIERDGWGRAKYYHLFKHHPGDGLYRTDSTKAISADIIHHIKLIDRLHQNRGVSVFASVMSRLNDIKDYEESERVAARIAAAMAFYIKKGMSEHYDPNDAGKVKDRHFDISPGIVFDDLMPGEDVGTIESNRPSQLLQSFRDSMLRAVSSGTRAGYSSLSKNYNGTYSAQRQELIENWDDYGLLTGWFIHMHTRPIYEQWLKLAIASGQILIPSEIDRDSLFDADFSGPAMPWIDPQREANGNRLNLGNMTTSPQKIIRARGHNPDDIIEQWKQWQDEINAVGVIPPTGPMEPITESTPKD